MVCMPLTFDDHVAEAWATCRVMRRSRYVLRWVLEIPDAVGVRAVADPASPFGIVGDRNVDVDPRAGTVAATVSTCVALTRVVQTRWRTSVVRRSLSANDRRRG